MLEEKSEVKVMEDYIEVRRMRYEDELTLREIARQTGFHRDTIKKILEQGARRVLASVASPPHIGLPRFPGGSASATSLSRLAQG